jgi:hypothetical protein
MRLAGIVAAAWLPLAFAATAHAAAPSLLTVDHQDRHPVATFTAPGADDATIYFATKPDRATDGRFLEENVSHLDLLTAEEIQAGRWLDSAQLDPGTYYVLLRATDYDCLGDPNCIDGFSNMLSVAIPTPAQKYTGRVKTYRFVSTVDLTLKIAPLGEDVPYRVCWTRVNRPRRCARGVVDGYSWDSAATDTISVRKRGMRKHTTFTWYVDGHRVARKRARIRRAT